MKHNRLATALVVTGSVLGLAACSWFGGDNNSQSSAAPGYSSQTRSTASNTGASGSSASQGSFNSGATASSSGSSSMNANVGSSHTASASGTSSTEMADVQQHLQQLGYY